MATATGRPASIGIGEDVAVDRTVGLAYAAAKAAHPAILDSGVYESAKAAVHGAALGLGMVMCAYNTAAWIVRRQQHLFVNACLYSAFCLWEVRLVTHHLEMALKSTASAVPPSGLHK